MRQHRALTDIVFVVIIMMHHADLSNPCNPLQFLLAWVRAEVRNPR